MTSIGRWLDLLLLAMLVIAALGGVRRGLAVELLRYVGLIVGLFLGAWVATRIGLLVSAQDSPQRLLIGVAIFVLVAMLGQTAGVRAGIRVRRAVNGRVAQGIDAAGGAVIATLVAAIAMWLLGNALAAGPIPAVSRAIADSVVLRTIDRVTPRPPAAFAEIRRLFNRSVFPDVFAQIRPPVADGAPPVAGETAGITRAARSTVRIESQGCGGLVFGSGFPITGELFVTNAHVVAGTQAQVVRSLDGRRRRATVVQFDPVRDLAVLRVARSPLTPLVPRAEAPSGTVGAVIGYPGGGGQQIVGARVAARTAAVGRDIYSRALARREIYVLRARIRKGDSGGPIVDRQGRLLGVVFAASTLDSREGYALTAGELRRSLDANRPADGPVGVGECAA
ncbi:MAG TPA: MarP family serine protease [Actinomycetes bacterium]|nr:MarP family serine protease [Actinomycetes bacterium]